MTSNVLASGIHKHKSSYAAVLKGKSQSCAADDLESQGHASNRGSRPPTLRLEDRTNSPATLETLTLSTPPLTPSKSDLDIPEVSRRASLRHLRDRLKELCERSRANDCDLTSAIGQLGHSLNSSTGAETTGTGSLLSSNHRAPYRAVFRAVSNAEFDDELAGSCTSSGLDAFTADPDQIAVWRTRFHCAAYHYKGGDTFCACCIRRSRSERMLRNTAIEMAIQLYQRFTEHSLGYCAGYWSALLNAREFLAEQWLDLDDIIYELKLSQRDSDAPLQSVLATSWTQFGCNAEASQQEKPSAHDTLAQNVQALPSCDLARPLAEIADIADSQVEPCLDSLNLPTEDCTMQVDVLRSQVSTFSGCGDILSDHDSTQSSVVNPAKITKKKAKKKKAKQRQNPAVRPGIVLQNDDLLIKSREVAAPHRAYHMTNGQVFYYAYIQDIPVDIFLNGVEARGLLDQYFSNCIHICKAEEMQAELRAMGSSWEIDHDARCIQVYLDHMYQERMCRQQRIIPIQEIQARVLNGITNERVRLSLGQISVEDHVKTALREDGRPKSARLEKVRNALIALYDYTMQQFWERYHLIPDDRIALLDQLKRKLNGLGGKFNPSGYSRKMGEGFFEVFAGLQEAHLKNTLQSQPATVHVVADKDFDIQRYQNGNTGKYDNIIVYGEE